MLAERRPSTCVGRRRHRLLGVAVRLLPGRRVIVAGLGRGLRRSPSRIAVVTPVGRGRCADAGRSTGEPTARTGWRPVDGVAGAGRGHRRLRPAHLGRGRPPAHAGASTASSRLADANALLFALHRVAQTLPGSLDLDEVLDSTDDPAPRPLRLRRRRRARCSTRPTAAGAGRRGRRAASRLPGRLTADELPAAARSGPSPAAPSSRCPTSAAGGPGPVRPAPARGLYVVAAGPGLGRSACSPSSTTTPTTSTGATSSCSTGFVEPAALAIDNARWFGRLRTVGADEERTRIARDLHDRIGQSLAYLAFELDRIVRADERGDDVARRRSSSCATTSARVIGEVRDTLYDLRTDVSDEPGHPHRPCELFVDRVRERSGIDGRAVRRRERPAAAPPGAGAVPHRPGGAGQRRAPRRAPATSRSRGGATGAPPTARGHRRRRGLPGRPGRAARLLRHHRHAGAGGEHRRHPRHRQPSPARAPASGASAASDRVAPPALSGRSPSEAAADLGSPRRGHPPRCSPTTTACCARGCGARSTDEGFDVVGEAADGDEAVRLAERAPARRRPDGRHHARARRRRGDPPDPSPRCPRPGS